MRLDISRIGGSQIAGYRFATPSEAEAMQRWIDESGIATRPAPEKYCGPMLSVGRYGKD